MTKAEANRILREIETSSSRELEEALAHARAAASRNSRTGAAVGAGAGAVAGAMTANSSPWMRVLGAVLGGALGGGTGYGIGALMGRGKRSRLYKEIKRRKDERMSDLLGKMDEKSSRTLQDDMAARHAGIQSRNTDYGVFVSGKGTYSDNDKLVLKKDQDGRPLLSLLFAGINSAVEDGGASKAKSPLAERFYNKNRGKFSDVQANTIFDDPIVADAYLDKIVSKIMANRAKTGKYPRVRLVGYSAGGRGVVNFLKKMRERDPNFRADEIIGIDAYQRPWEKIPQSLRDPSNPVADRIVYSRPENKYTGSSQKGLGRLVDIASNTAVALAGKSLRGLSANTVVENHLPDVAHTDAEQMYDSALEILSNLNNKKKRGMYE